MSTGHDLTLHLVAVGGSVSPAPLALGAPSVAAFDATAAALGLPLRLTSLARRQIGQSELVYALGALGAIERPVVARAIDHNF